ncbi:MAG TPA: ChbG/HpnK family deacetylase [Candidatus Sulfotelmatobacter sp.]|nr:ChbG/HpnK family deacetylase [Candidatus Sulfotelmatobacter sp.]
MARLLIVNADDFNLTEGVSRGIVAGHQQGIITSTTALVNLPGLERSVEVAGLAPGLGVGLHVNLVLGSPVLPAGRVPSLVAGGQFVRDRERLATAGEPAEIRAEIGAQVERFQMAFGRRPTHLDSHYHVHRHPRVLDALAEVAARLGIPVRALDPAMARQLRARGIVASDRAEGDVGPLPYWTPARLMAFVRNLPDGVTEVVAHPGHWDPALAVSSYARQREAELQALSDPAVREAVAASGAELVSYADLVALGAGR